MKRLIAVVLAIGLVAQGSGASSNRKDVLEFETLVGVDGAFVGTADPIRGVPGGGLPWQIDEAEGDSGRTDG